jgi:hypothetical protein
VTENTHHTNTAITRSSGKANTELEIVPEYRSAFYNLIKSDFFLCVTVEMSSENGYEDVKHWLPSIYPSALQHQC